MYTGRFSCCTQHTENNCISLSLSLSLFLSLAFFLFFDLFVRFSYPFTCALLCALIGSLQRPDWCGPHGSRVELTFLASAVIFLLLHFKNMRGKRTLTIAGGIKQPRYKQSSQSRFCSSILNSILDKCNKGLNTHNPTP